MKTIISIILSILLTYPIMAQSKDEVPFTISSDGVTKEDAIKSALRLAIEQSYGAFVSGNTTILNDEVVKDEIVTLSTGSIKSYEVVSATQSNSNKWFVTVKGVVSLPHLIKYARNHGSECEFAGNTFGMQIKLIDIEKENERKALKNLDELLQKTLINTISWDATFDIKANVGNESLYNQLREKSYSPDDFYQVNATIYARTLPESQKNKKRVSLVGEILFNTLDAIKLNDDQIRAYSSMGVYRGSAWDPRFPIERTLYRRGVGMSFRNADADYILKTIYNNLRVICLSFKIVDNMGIDHNFGARILGDRNISSPLLDYGWAAKKIGRWDETADKNNILMSVPWRQTLLPGLFYEFERKDSEDDYRDKDRLPICTLSFVIPKNDINKYSSFKIVSSLK